MRSLRLDPLSAAALVVLAVFGIGSAIALSPVGAGGKKLEIPASEAPPPRDGFGALFAEGVNYLKEGRAHEAATVFEAARRLNPRIPEVWVNLGYAYLTQGEIHLARQHFERALDINPQQVNAYWGLANALEAQGDLEGALGAMRTFMHREKRDSPYWRKADAAIWELEDQIRRKREGASEELPPGAVMLPDKVPAKTFNDIRKDRPASKEGAQ